MNKEFNISNYDVLNTFCDPMAVIDQSGLIITVNKAWRKFSADNGGNDEFTCEGVNYFRICEGVVGMEKETATATVLGIRKVFTGEKKVFEIEYPCDSSTEKRWFLLKAIILQGEEPLCLLTHLNITRRKLAEIEIENKNILLMEFNQKLNTTIYRLAHDIQSPLNSIKGVISLNKDNIITIEQTVDLIELSVKNLSKFLEATVRVAMDPSEENLTEIDFEELLKEIIASVKYLKSDVSIKFEVRGKEPFFSYILDLRTILSNIIANSIKYSDSEKKVKEINVIISKGETSVCIIIEDNGIGINEKNIAKVFDFNFQENRNSTGYGLGLYMVKYSLEKLKGSFSIKSESKKGTQFLFDIPNMKSKLRSE